MKSKVIKFRCPPCGQSISALEQDAGTNGACPVCGEAVVVPYLPGSRRLALVMTGIVGMVLLAAGVVWVSLKSQIHPTPAHGAAAKPARLRIGSSVFHKMGGQATFRPPYGFIDGAGKLIIPPQWSDARPFIEGIALVEQGRKSGFIDQTGAYISPPQWDQAFSFSEGLAAVKKEQKWGFIDKTGAVVIQPQWTEVGRNFVEGLAPVRQDFKWGYINRAGALVIDVHWDNSGANWFHNGLASVWQNDQHLYIDKTGTPVQTQWDSIYPLADGLAAVEKGGKWGYIDSTGAVVIPPSWKYPGTFENGIAAVGQGTAPERGYIDKTGKLLGHRMWTDGKPFADGMACVFEHGKWGYIDQTGTLVIQPCSDIGDDFIHGLAIVRQREKRGLKLGLIDKSGRFVVPVGWDGIESDRYDSLGYRLLIKASAADKAVAVWLDPELKEIWRAELPLEGDNSARAPVSDEKH